MKRPVSAIALLLLLSACSGAAPGTPSAAPSVSASPGTDVVGFATANAIIQQRCASCHAASPTQAGFRSPAGGVSLETPGQIMAQTNRILVRAVQTRSMPMGNVTGMTESEREQLGSWIRAGAKQ